MKILTHKKYMSLCKRLAKIATELNLSKDEIEIVKFIFYRALQKKYPERKASILQNGELVKIPRDQINL